MIKAYILKFRIPLLITFGVFFVLCLWFYLSLPDVAYLQNSNPQTTAMMELRKEQAKEKGVKYRIKQEWVQFRKIPDLLKKSIRITEDAGFYKHAGVDWTEIQESVKKNLSEGSFSRGGSTISQQLAKNLYLSTEKSVFRKFRELFITFRLENELGKNRLYHIYLNVIEFGPGVFGVQAASKYYFNKNVWELSLSEMVRLTAVIPRPLTINAADSSKWLHWKSRWILKKLKKYKFIDQVQYNSTIRVFD